jgi:hypothetical protein
MSGLAQTQACRNLLLAALPPAVLATLTPDMRPLPLAVRTTLTARRSEQFPRAAKKYQTTRQDAARPEPDPTMAFPPRINYLRGSSVFTSKILNEAAETNSRNPVSAR